MYKEMIINFMELLSLTLVLSFLIFHNIYIVMIGILVSIYLIYKEKIVSFANYFNIKTRWNSQDEISDKDKKDKSIKTESYTNGSIKEESRLTLVEEIEEYGIIPSIEQEKDKNAA